MKWLNFFSIKQKLASLLFFLLSSISYLVISTINDVEQHKQNNLKIEIAQQQHLIVEQYINAYFLARQQSSLTNEKASNSELKKNQFLFEQNLQAMLYGGKTYLDFAMKKSVYHQAISNLAIKADVEMSKMLWKDLQSASQNLPLATLTIEQLTVFHHLSNKLREKLTTVVNSLIVVRDQNQHQDLLILQLSWLFILVVGSVFGWLIARNIIQPLDGIAKVASRIRLGDLQSYPVNESHNDEIGTLLYQADEMRLVLSEIIQTIQRHNKQINHSSTQANGLSDEMNRLNHLHSEEHRNITENIIALQQQNYEQLIQITQQMDLNLISRQAITSYKQSFIVTTNSINALQRNNNVSIDSITKVTEYAQQLPQELNNLEDIAVKTESLAKKTTIDAARAGKHSEQFTLAANQMAHFAAKTTSNIATITSLIKGFKTQITLLSNSVTSVNEQLNNAQQQISQSSVLVEGLYNTIERQYQHSLTLIQKNEQQTSHIEETQQSLEVALHLIKETSEKTETSDLFVKDLKNISILLAQLTNDFKFDENETRARRGNDKRLYPRIHNQLKIVLQQQEKSLQGLTQDLSLSGLQLKSMTSEKFSINTPVLFLINLPNNEIDDEVQTLTLLGDVIHYEQQGDIFYYGVHFHKLSEQQQKTLQIIFDYFDKQSHFKN